MTLKRLALFFSLFMSVTAFADTDCNALSTMPLDKGVIISAQWFDKKEGGRHF